MLFKNCMIDWFQSFLSTKCHTLDNIALALFNLTATLLVCWFQFKFSSILTPKHFTESVSYFLLLFNFSFKVVSVCFLVDLKMTTSVLLTLNQILLTLSQYERCFKSWPTCLFRFLIGLLKFKRFVSSAKLWTLQYFIAK